MGFLVNDVVVYGRHGVCQVTQIGTISMSMADRHKLYYTLRPIYGHDALIYVPVDRADGTMRPVISKEEAQELIQDIPEMESVWVANEKEREQQYKEILRACDCRGLVRMIKSLYQRKKARVQQGKKMTAVDERYFHQAEEQLYEELAYALEMEKEQVLPFIMDSLMQKK